MSTIAVYSLKGGVGKTTLAVNLAWCAAIQSARRTLLWDLDPQAASTYLLPVKGKRRDSAQAAFTKDVDLEKLIRPTDIDRLDLIGADTSLRSLDLTFHELDKKKRLAKLLDSVDNNYDRVILDCPPGITETSEQVIRAADLVVIPVIPSPLATRAFDEVIAFLRQHGRKKLKVLPVYTMVDRRRTLHRDTIAQHPDWPVIPMASVVESMAAKLAPVGDFASRSPAGRAFADMWQGIEQTLTGKG